MHSSALPPFPTTDTKSNEMEGRVDSVDQKKFWYQDKHTQQYGALSNESAKALLDWMRKNGYRTLVSVGGGNGQELAYLKTIAKNHNVSVVITDPYEGWKSQNNEVEQLTAKEAVEKYKDITTMFYASWPHPSYPYVNDLVNAKVAFVYLGDRTNNGISALSIEEIENVRWESELDDTSYAITKEHLEAGLPGYSVPDITLHGYIEDKGWSTIGWILVPKTQEILVPKTQESSSCLVC